MLTPFDKISRKPRGNDIIQIVLTRKCDTFDCSNCTQLLPYRQDDMEMSLECVELALKSVQDWPGIVAMFGGNPVTHSKFIDLCCLWEKYVPDQKRRGLWTNNLMSGPKAEAARKTFWPKGRFNLNVHGNLKAAQMMKDWLPGIKVYGTKPSHHGQVLGSHADLGVPEDEWIAARENCDVNQNWSSGVYGRTVDCDCCYTLPNGSPSGMQRVQGGGSTQCSYCLGTKKVQRPFVYFCEIAGSIDGVTGENHGIPAEPGWWKLPIERFQNQIDGCCDKYCVVPLRLKGRNDDERVYDITPSVQRFTENPKGPVTTVVHTEKRETLKELTDYIGLRK